MGGPATWWLVRMPALASLARSEFFNDEDVYIYVISANMQARANSTPIIDENELLELIRSRPTPSKRWTKKGVGTHTSKKGASAKMTKSFSSRKWCSSDSVPHDSCPDSRLVQTESLSTSMSRTDEMEGCVVEKADIADRGKTEPGKGEEGWVQLLRVTVPLCKVVEYFSVVFFRTTVVGRQIPPGFH